MAYEYKLTRMVEFSETDMAGIMHFTHFFRFMEAAEHAFYRSLGFSVDSQGFDRMIGWPRVRASCDYRRPLRFEDQVQVHLLVRQKQSKSITYDFVFHKLDGGRTVEEVARGELVVVCVTRDSPGAPMRAVDIPSTIAHRIEPAPRELLQSPA